MTSLRKHIWKINISPKLGYRNGDYENYYSSPFYPEDRGSRFLKLHSAKFHKAVILHTFMYFSAILFHYSIAQVVQIINEVKKKPGLNNDSILTSLDSIFFCGAALHNITPHKNTVKTGRAILCDVY
jgi:hypothetical protein